MWAKRLEADGVLKWVDDKGADFPDDKTLNTAKRAGKAHLQAIAQTSDPWSSLGLPSPLELTLESTWRTTGADFQLYDLKLEAVTTPGQAVPEQAAPSATLPDTFQEEVPELAEDSEPAEDNVLELF